MILAANPLVPTAFDAVWATLAFAGIALMVVALASIVRHRRELSTARLLLWALVAIVVPVAGPTAWLLNGRPARSGTTAHPR